MMSVDYNPEQKQIYFKAYKALSQLENALQRIEEENASRLQVSVLGKVAQFFIEYNTKPSEDIAVIKTYWKDVFGKSVNFGHFYNAENCSVFVVGALVTSFLHKISGKSLATLSSGSYGIFRGIGASEAQATKYLKLLNSGNYLLILRGYQDDIEELDEILQIQ